MARGDTQVLPGKARKPRPAAVVAARVAKVLPNVRRKPKEGVRTLNPGFFTLERMRSLAATKSRAAVREKLRDGR